MLAKIKTFFTTQQAEDDQLANIVAQDRSLVYTPDIMLLEQQAEHLVFLYCDRQLHHPRKIEDAEHIYDGQTKNSYLLWKHDMGELSHPIAMNAHPAFRRLPHLPIKGEIVKMSTQQLVALDYDKSNRLQFKRVKVPIEVKLHKLSYTKERDFMEKHHGIPHIRGDMYPLPVSYTIPAWMYVGRSKFWTPLLDGGYLFKQGTIVSHRRTNVAKYYHFPPTEYP